MCINVFMSVSWWYLCVYVRKNVLVFDVVWMYLEECVSENACICVWMHAKWCIWKCLWAVCMSVFVCESIVCVWMCMWEREGENVLVCEVVWMYVGGSMSENVWEYAYVSEHVWVWYVSICVYVRCVCAWMVVCLMVHVWVYVCKSMCEYVCEGVCLSVCVTQLT
jgi:hypothetical protein